MSNISIIITYSGKTKLLMKNLDKLKSQIIPGDEIILVNDSDDDIHALIYNCDYVDYCELINVDKKDNNMVIARNRGASRAINDILLFLDEDMLPSPKLLNIYRELVPKYNVVCGAIRWIHNNGDIDIDYRVHRFNSSNYGKEQVIKANVLSEYGMGGGGNFAVNQFLFFRSGMFDERFNGKWGSEDINLWRCFMSFGYDLYYSHEALAYHQYHKRNLNGIEETKRLLDDIWGKDYNTELT